MAVSAPVEPAAPQRHEFPSDKRGAKDFKRAIKAYKKAYKRWQKAYKKYARNARKLGKTESRQAGQTDRTDSRQGARTDRTAITGELPGAPVANALDSAFTAVGDVAEAYVSGFLPGEAGLGFGLGGAGGDVEPDDEEATDYTTPALIGLGVIGAAAAVYAATRG